MDTLDADCIGLVLAFAASHAPATRAVCRRWQTLAPTREKAGALALRALAESGGGGALLRWCFGGDAGPPVAARSADAILRGAAAGGREDLCHLARGWGAADFDGMLEEATRGGHEGLCHLARGWGAADFDGMLEEATRGGHEYLCHLARAWGATRFDRMLLLAAHGGRADLCRLAKGWGATDFDGMLLYAAVARHEHLYELAGSWGSRWRPPANDEDSDERHRYA